MSLDRLKLARSASMSECSSYSATDSILRAALSTIREDGDYRSWSGSWISVEELSVAASLTTTLDAAEKAMDVYFERGNTREQGNTARDLPEPKTATQNLQTAGFNSSLHDTTVDLYGTNSFGTARSGCSSEESMRSLRKMASVKVVESPELIPTSDVVRKALRELAYSDSESSDDAQNSLTMVRSWASAPSKMVPSAASKSSMSPQELKRESVRAALVRLAMKSESAPMPMEIPSHGSSSSSRSGISDLPSVEDMAALEWKLRIEKVKSKLRHRMAEKQRLEESALPTISEDGEQAKQRLNTAIEEGRASASTKLQPSLSLGSSLPSEETETPTESSLDEDDSDETSQHMNLSAISLQSHANSMPSSTITDSADDLSDATTTDSQTFLSASSQIASFSEDNLADRMVKRPIALPELQETSFRSFSSEEDAILTNVLSEDLSLADTTFSEEVVAGIDRIDTQGSNKMNLLGVMVFDDGKMVSALLADESAHDCTIETTLVDMGCVDKPDETDEAPADQAAATLEDSPETAPPQKKRTWRLPGVGKKLRESEWSEGPRFFLRKGIATR